MEYTINIELPPTPKSISVFIGAGLLQSSDFLQCLKSTKASQLYIITDSTVEQMHSAKVENFLKNEGFLVTTLTFAAGESQKNRNTKHQLEDQMLAQGASRDSCILALGGGNVTDIAGYLASTYCRGIPLITAPSSLLSMVDAGIGGKTGVNVAQGKNLIGTIYQPNAIFIDTTLLTTLPVCEIKNGVVEMIKHGLIVDGAYFDYLKNNATNILSLDLNVMQEAIYKSCLIKSKIVQEDETESAKRRLLNLGHTIGHAIESASNHLIPHGKAVAMGILGEGYIAMQMGYLPKNDFESIREIFDVYQIDFHLPQPLSVDTLKTIMTIDKKALNKKPRFVILEGIGKTNDCEGQYCRDVDDTLLNEGLTWLQKNVFIM